MLASANVWDVHPPDPTGLYCVTFSYPAVQGLPPAQTFTATVSWGLPVSAVPAGGAAATAVAAFQHITLTATGTPQPSKKRAQQAAAAAALSTPAMKAVLASLQAPFLQQQLLQPSGSTAVPVQLPLATSMATCSLMHQPAADFTAQVTTGTQLIQPMDVDSSPAGPYFSTPAGTGPCAHSQAAAAAAAAAAHASAPAGPQESPSAAVPKLELSALEGLTAAAAAMLSPQSQSPVTPAGLPSSSSQHTSTGTPSASAGMQAATAAQLEAGAGAATGAGAAAAGAGSAAAFDASTNYKAQLQECVQRVCVAVKELVPLPFYSSFAQVTHSYTSTD